MYLLFIFVLEFFQRNITKSMIFRYCNIVIKYPHQPINLLTKCNYRKLFLPSSIYLYFSLAKNMALLDFLHNQTSRNRQD